MWDKGRNSHIFTIDNLEKSQFLIDTIAEFNLQMTLLKDIPTLCEGVTSGVLRHSKILLGHGG